MTRVNLSRIILTTVLALSTVASFILDWRGNHLLNPAWHPHARFHGGLLLFTLAGMAVIGIWVLWRHSLEPLFAIRVSALLALAYWTPLFYVNALVPGSSLWAGEPGGGPRLGGHVIYPNLVVAALFVIVTIAAILIAKADNPIEIRHSVGADGGARSRACIHRPKITDAQLGA
jgi:uncharacterized protein DUF6640